MKKFTKKYIQSIIRTEDRTQIYRLFVLIYGNVAEKRLLGCHVARFIRTYAPTKRIARRSEDIAFPYPYPKWKSILYIYQKRFNRDNAKHVAMKYLRYQMSLPFDSHTKLPLMGKTHLYFASPYYGHRDCNKSQFLPIAGNERFCELICRVGERYYESIKVKAEG